MHLLLPLGLLALIALPLILFIHIIRPKYHERTISSTYVWKLANKYRKRKIPFEKLTQFFLILLQFLVVGMIAILLTRPLISSPNKIVNDQIILVDCSASMNVKDNEGKSRYQKAIDKIINSFNDYAESTNISLIFIDEDPREGNVLTSTNRTELEYALHQDGKCTYIEANDNKYASALDEAKALIQKNRNSEVTLYTDHDMKVSGDIKLVNVSSNEWNVALLNPTIKLNRETAYFDFKTSICSYNKDADVVVELYINAPYTNTNLDLDAGRYYENKIVHLKSNEEKSIEFEDLKVYQFKEASFTIREKEYSSEIINDRFMDDNVFHAYNGSDEKFKVQIISESKQFFSAAISVLGTCDEVIVSKPGFAKSGYDLYIYDTTAPFTLPKDGAVWIVNPSSNSLFGKESNSDGLFQTSDVIKEKRSSLVSDSISKEDVKTVVNNIQKENAFYVTEYIDIESYDQSVFDVCIETDNGKPLLLAGKKEQTYLSVFCFDLHKSNLPVRMFMPLLIKNLMEYSVKRPVENHFYDVGDTISLNSNETINQIDLIHNGETIIFSKDALSLGAKYKINTSGVYSIVVTYNNGTKKEYSFFAGIALNESKLNITNNIALPDKEGDQVTGQEVKSEDKDISIYFAIALIVLLVVEWGVQYREQY